MDFHFTEDQIAFREMARRFADEQMAPHAARWDEDKIFPREVLQQAAALGFGGIYVGEDYGGSGLSRLDAVIILHELARACPSTAAFLSIHNMAAWMIDAHGSPEQREKWIPDLCTMSKIASYCLTEPGAGSDAASLKTRAVRNGGDYVLNGAKAFISGAGDDGSEVYVIMARTGDEGAKGISTFVVEKGTPGLSFGAQEKKLGWHSQPTAMVNLDDCRIPADNRIGEEGDGFKIAMRGLDGGRLNIATCSLGGAEFCLETAVDYVKERKQFGRPIADFQATQFRLADMQTEFQAARLLLYQAASRVDQKFPDATMFAAMAKRLATDTGFRVADQALQLHGGYGYLMDYPIERILRDLRVHQILEGTNEIMRVVISRAMLKD